MSQPWRIEPGVSLTVFIVGAGPLEPFQVPVFDVTGYVMADPGITISRGRSSEFDNFQSGTCTFHLNNEGRRFDPTNASSPYIAVLKPSRMVVLQFSYAGVGETFYLGYLDGWPQSQDRADRRPVVEIVCKDFLSILSRTRVSATTFTLDVSLLDIDNLSGDLPEQFTGERIAALLSMAGFDVSTMRDIDRGITVLPASNGTGVVLSQSQDAEMAEAGFLYVARNGAITFLDRHRRFSDPRLSTVQTTFTQEEYGGIQVDNDLVRTWNDVRFSRPGGLPQIARNDASIADHGLLTFPESGEAEEIQVLSDGEALARAQFWVQRYAGIAPRPSPITIKPRRNMPGLFLRCVQRDLMDLIAIERTPQGVGSTTTYTGHIQSVTHQITNEDWTTTLAIAPYDVQANTGFLVLDDGALGKVGVGRLAY